MKENLKSKMINESIFSEKVKKEFDSTYGFVDQSLKLVTLENIIKLVSLD